MPLYLLIPLIVASICTLFCFIWYIACRIKADEMRFESEALRGESDELEKKLVDNPMKPEQVTWTDDTEIKKRQADEHNLATADQALRKRWEADRLDRMRPFYEGCARQAARWTIGSAIALAVFAALPFMI
jgi:hypothetical protein